MPKLGASVIGGARSRDLARAVDLDTERRLGTNTLSQDFKIQIEWCVGQGYSKCTHYWEDRRGHRAKQIPGMPPAYTLEHPPCFLTDHYLNNAQHREYSICSFSLSKVGISGTKQASARA